MSFPLTIAEILSGASQNPDTTTRSLQASLGELDPRKGRLHRQLIEQEEYYERLRVNQAGAQEVEQAYEADRSIDPRTTVACRDTDSSTIYFADKTNSFAVHTADDGAWHSFMLRTSKKPQSGAAIVPRGGVFDSDLPEVNLTKDSVWFDYYIAGHTDVMSEMNEICQDAADFARVGTYDPPFANSHPVVGFASSESLPDSMTIEELHEWAKSGKLKPLMDALWDVEF